MLKEIIKDFFTVRSIITLGAFFTLYGSVWTGKEIAPEIMRIVDLLLGFWFGSKVTKALYKKEE